MNLLDIYLIDVNNYTVFKKRSYCMRFIDKKLIKFTAIAFLFLIVKMLAEFLAEYLTSR